MDLEPRVSMKHSEYIKIFALFALFYLWYSVCAYVQTCIFVTNHLELIISLDYGLLLLLAQNDILKVSLSFEK